ncbi:MAG: hypothetical protein PHW60_01185 [Kiritimatiellae bacterium]|nr:hypothetical protein [Kiritimatiellia bacterium]
MRMLVDRLQVGLPEEVGEEEIPLLLIAPVEREEEEIRVILLIVVW